jgi:hypothetical protein
LRGLFGGDSTHFLFYGRHDTKSLGKSLKFVKTLSNTLAFTCCRDSPGLASRGNRLSVPFQPPRPTSKLGSFEEPQVSGKSGSLTIPSLAKPLYEATKWGEWEPLVWEKEPEKAFREIKRALTNAPALVLPDVMKPFFLNVHEQKGTAVGVLTQLLGSWHHPVAYLSKQLDAVA